MEAAELSGDYLLFHPEGVSASAVHVLASFASQGIGNHEEVLADFRLALAPETGMLARSLLLAS